MRTVNALVAGTWLSAVALVVSAAAGMQTAALVSGAVGLHCGVAALRGMRGT